MGTPSVGVAFVLTLRFAAVFADDLIRPWYDALAEASPGIRPFDVHTHIGEADPDEFTSRPEELLASLEEIDGRACVFPMHEPAGYPPANDRVIAEAEASGGRLVPFCRVDPHAGAVEEAQRALGAGARGIKLHPRAEQFTLDHPAVGGLCELAQERRVPIIVHAGRGIPALGRHALEHARNHPGARIILAHAGICDLAWLWRHAEECPNLLYDTSWWTGTDLVTLFALVPPSRILFGSDMPYGTPLHGSLMALACAHHVGLSEEAIRSVMGEQLERLLAGEELAELGPAPAAGGSDGHGGDMLLDRIHTFLVQAIVGCFVRVDPEQAVSLARLCCEVGDDAPQAEVCRSVLALLDRFEHYSESRSDDIRDFRGGHLLSTAAMLCKAPGIPLPEAPEPVSVSERPA
jgi:predicted TIM-barrel fold metal-dependent hydrolase